MTRESTRKDQLSPVDQDEEDIRNRAIMYTTIFFVPPARRERAEFETLALAKTFEERGLQEQQSYRSALIYAVDDRERSALVGTMHRSDLKWKPAVPKKKK